MMVNIAERMISPEQNGTVSIWRQLHPSLDHFKFKYCGKPNFINHPQVITISMGGISNHPQMAYGIGFPTLGRNPNLGWRI